MPWRDFQGRGRLSHALAMNLRGMMPLDTTRAGSPVHRPGKYEGPGGVAPGRVVCHAQSSPPAQPMRLLFSSIHSDLDPSGGAAPETRELLAARRMDCRAFCARIDS